MILNGIAIVGVVLSHAAGWGQVAMVEWADHYTLSTGLRIDQMGSLTYYILFIIRQLTSLSVPIFLLTSGFFVAYAIRGSSYSPTSWKFIRSRLINLLIPYTIWSVVIFASDYFINGIRLAPHRYLINYLTVGATGSYYFVPLLATFYLLSPFLAPLAKTKPRLLLLGAFIIQALPLAARYLLILNRSQSPILEQIVNIPPVYAPYWGLFFTTGLVFGFNIEKFRRALEEHKQHLIIATAVCTLLNFIEPELIFQTTGIELRWLPFTFSGLLYTLAAAFLLLSLPIENAPLAKQATWLGSRSYGIYLIHWKSMEFISRIIYHFAVFILGIQILYQPILLVFGFGIPILFISLILKSPFRKTYPYLFG
jgi:peptidoglycan/LPS O-acetylase OafA/YrhL